MLLTGCFGPRNFENENDRLRRALLEAEQRIAALELELNERDSALAAASAGPLTVSGGATGAIDPEAVPRVASIEIGRVAVARDAAADVRTVSVPIRVLDGRGRFLQATGTLTVRVTELPTSPDAQPRVLNERVFTPIEVRDAYRSGFSGTHYRVDVGIPMSQNPIETLTNVAITARFDDAWTGRRFSAHRVIGR